jgi:hypothetical protein
MLTRTILLAAALAAASLAPIDPAQAQGRRDGSGPVGRMCADDINAYCGGLSHGQRAVRDCLQRNRSSLAVQCRAALDNTGGGAGMGRQMR